MRRLVVLLALALAAAAIATVTVPAPAADAARLKERTTNLVVKAPRGYKIRHRRGAYKVSRRGNYVRFIRVRSRLNAKNVARQFVKGVRGRPKQQTSRKRGKTYIIVYKRGKRFEQVHVNRKGKGTYDIIQMPANNPKKKRSFRSVARSSSVTRERSFTLAAVANLLRIANSRRGGRVVTLNTPIPSRTCAGGGATARVPNLPGWTCNPGSGGEIFGGHRVQGFYHLGGVTAYSAIGGGALELIDASMTNGRFQNYLRLAGATGATLRQVQKIPGTDGRLGLGYTSAMYRVRATINGRSYDLLVLAGSADPTIGFPYMYVSMIGLQTGSPVPGLGPALINAWATWDNTVAVNTRIAQIINTIRTTPIGKPIDPEVFDRSVQQFTDYIRM